MSHPDEARDLVRGWHDRTCSYPASHGWKACPGFLPASLRSPDGRWYVAVSDHAEYTPFYVPRDPDEPWKFGDTRRSLYAAFTDMTKRALVMSPGLIQVAVASGDAPVLFMDPAMLPWRAASPPPPPQGYVELRVARNGEPYGVHYAQPDDKHIYVLITEVGEEAVADRTAVHELFTREHSHRPHQPCVHCPPELLIRKWNGPRNPVDRSLAFTALMELEPGFGGLPASFADTRMLDFLDEFYASGWLNMYSFAVDLYGKKPS